MMTDSSLMNLAQEAGWRMLDENAGNKPFGVMALDGYANLPTERMDAIVVDLRCYVKSSRLNTSPMKLVINIPYRPLDHADGLAVYAPLVLDTTMERSKLGDLLDAFYIGLSSHSYPATPFGPEFSWEKFLRKEGTGGIH